MSRATGRFRPRLGPTLFTIVVALVCVGLGVWQLQRLEWKSALIAQRDAALAAPPVPPPQSLAEARPLEYRAVVDDGAFLNDKEIHLHAPGPQGGIGFDVLTPLREPGGRIVFVNRGYVPTELRDPATRRTGEPQGAVRVEGRLRLGHDVKPGWFLPDNRPARDEWFWIDLPAMAAAEGLSNVAPFYIEADATPNPGGWPKGSARLPALPNNHLQYAITWFGLAGAAVLVWGLSQREPPPLDKG